MFCCSCRHLDAALHWAAKNGQTAACQLLIASKADVDVTDWCAHLFLKLVADFVLYLFLKFASDFLF